MPARYANLDAIQAHKNAPYFAEAMKQGADLMAAPPRISIIQKKGGFNR
jgi:quinol monooxygenase YgiN